MPADALETCCPSTSAGARMYLLAPVREHPTIVSDGESAPVPC